MTRRKQIEVVGPEEQIRAIAQRVGICDKSAVKDLIAILHAEVIAIATSIELHADEECDYPSIRRALLSEAVLIRSRIK